MLALVLNLPRSLLGRIKGRCIFTSLILLFLLLINISPAFIRIMSTLHVLVYGGVVAMVIYATYELYLRFIKLIRSKVRFHQIYHFLSSISTSLPLLNFCIIALKHFHLAHVSVLKGPSFLTSRNFILTNYRPEKYK